MAKVEMDLSEYEALKENKRLLETSLEKERELQEELKKLNEEKIQALEDAKMKVIKVTKEEKTEHLLVRHTVVHDALMELFMSFGMDWCNASNLLSQNHSYSYNDNDNAFHRFVDKVFDKTTSYSHPPVTEVTTHGLDDIKAEIREDLKSKLDSEIQNKLDQAEKALVNNTKLSTRVQELISDNDHYVKLNESLKKQCEVLSEDVKYSKDSVIKMDNIRKSLDRSHGFGSKSKIIRDVSIIVNS